MREAASFIASQTASAPADALSALARMLRRGFRLWSARRKLTRLTELDDHLLADIGLTREDVRLALDLPFSHEPVQELQKRALRNRARGWRGAR